MTKQDWQYLWHIKIPHKITIFLWKCLHNGIPSASNLNIRFHQGIKCAFCDQDETVAHILFTCPRAIHFWFASSFGYRHAGGASSFVDIWKNFMSALSNLGTAADVELFCFHLWYLWKSRNILLFKHLTIPVSEVIALSTSACSEFQEVQKINECLEASGGAEVLGSPHPPISYPDHTIVLQYDAAVDKQKQLGVIAVVATNSQRQPIAKFSAIFRHIWDPGILELLALREAMNWASYNGWHSVSFEGDALQVSATINSGICTNVVWQNICEDIWHLQQAFDTSEFHYIPRRFNKDAHLFGCQCHRKPVGLPSKAEKHFLNADTLVLHTTATLPPPFIITIINIYLAKTISGCLCYTFLFI
ncbi:uncharacterized protein LOC126671792 [Mercurialis annua]|uniref:uncharacterized protein LOC126671792 n=1 Tax=Mercurialis annua TaxID=3986 RepID=UPI00215E54CB|nr:uncharacterized protein LOC126671792 [Mercurialis annua]